jgi:uncharacterized protein YkwD
MIAGVAMALTATISNPSLASTPPPASNRHLASQQPLDVRAARLFSVLLFVVTVFFWPLVAVDAQQPTAERALFDAANRERAAHGLRPLRWDDALASAARDHAMRMVQRNVLSHQFPGELPLQDRARIAGARYTVIAENVAEGSTPDVIHSSWMHSPPHRANLLGPELNAVGIAVAIMTDRRSGVAMLFAVEDFSQSVAELSFEQQERQVSALLAARGLQATTGADEARKTCGMDRGWVGARPGLVVRYEAADLSRLPDDLEQRLRVGQFHMAVVGACEAESGSGFIQFRIAVLLF